jgi:hypothetical protein
MQIDEMRKRANLPPTKGGDTVYLQQQNFSLEALAKRDAQEDPFARTSAKVPESAVEGDGGAATPSTDPNAPPTDPNTPQADDSAATPPKRFNLEERSAISWTREYYDAFADEVLSE